MTMGTMSVDFEERVNYDRLRRERLNKAKEQLKSYGLGALLCLDFDNIRYITGTHVGEWARNKMQRYTILPRDAEPLLYDPAAPAKRKTAPWIADRVFPAVGSMRGSIPPEVGNVESLAKSVKKVLTDAFNKAFEDPDFKKGIDRIGDEPRFGGAELMMEAIKREEKVTVPILKELGIYVGN